MKAIMAAAIGFVLLFAACDARETRVNNKEDLEGGEKVVTEFLNDRKAHDVDKAMELTQIGKDNPQYQQHLDNFKNIDAKAGAIVEFKLDSARSNIVKEGGESTGEIKLSYTVTYEHGTAQEDYYMAYMDDKLKIMQYVINL